MSGKKDAHKCVHIDEHPHTELHQRELIRALAAWLCSVYLIRRIHMLPPRRQDNAKETPFTDEPQYPRISLPKDIFLILLVLWGRGFKPNLVIKSESAGNVLLMCNHLLPVEQVVSGHHAKEACWVGNRVELVVEFFKLLVQKVSCLALCLAARATPERDGKRWESESFSAVKKNYWQAKK